MGMNYIMRHPKKDNLDLDNQIQKEVRTWLPRGYNAFASGPQATGDDCEFYQIEKLYDIDLSPLRFYNYGELGIYEENVYGELLWKLENAKSEEEKQNLQKIYAIKMKEAEQESKEEYENNWIATSIVKSTILILTDRIQKQPELLDQIEYFMFDKSAFDMSKKECFIKECFDQILNYIEIIEHHGVHRMAFYEGY